MQARVRRPFLSLALVVIMASVVSPFVGATPIAGPEEGQETDSDGAQYDQQPPYARTPWGGDRVHLTNRDYASDPTWEQLLAFLRADRTDERQYDPLTFPCGAFAEELHNNAEARGIRAAWVVIAFEGDDQTHALNAFQTTDRGLVWIDSSPSWFEPYSTPRNDYDAAQGSDKVAHVAVGAEYRLVGSHVAADFDYPYYSGYREERIERTTTQGLYYDDMAEGGQAPDSSPYIQTLSERLGGDAPIPYWGSLGTVADIEVYW